MYNTNTTGLLFASAGSIIAVLACYVLMVIGIWKMFTKAGEAGWKSLIPFYNGYMLYKMCWKTNMFWIQLLIGVVYAIFYGVGYANLASFYAYGYYGSMPTGAIVCLVLAVAAGIALFVLNILLSINISKAYGHGGGFAVGLILIPIIFYIILGFDSSRYVGNSETRNYNGIE